jgi:hypothetical protein
MQFIDLFVNERVLTAETALKQAASDDVIAKCRDYLEALSQFRKDLRELRVLSGLSNDYRTSLESELVAQARAAVLGVIETTVRETNRTETLLGFFTSISVHQAAKILNVCKHMGSSNWEAGSTGVRYLNGIESGMMSVEKAVQVAGQLRREAYVVINKNVDMSSAFREGVPAVV